MNNSIVRFPNGTFVTYFGGVTRAVEYGFIAAGVTVAALAVFQSLAIVASWFAAL